MQQFIGDNWGVNRHTTWCSVHVI